MNHLEQFKERLMPCPKDWKGEWKGRKQGTYKWYEYRMLLDYFKEFEKQFIYYQEICTYQSFAWCEGRIYCNNKVFIIPEVLNYLLGLLNSNITWFFLNKQHLNCKVEL